MYRSGINHIFVVVSYNLPFLHKTDGDLQILVHEGNVLQLYFKFCGKTHSQGIKFSTSVEHSNNVCFISYHPFPKQMLI